MRNEEGREGGKRQSLFSGGGDRGIFALQILLSSFLQHICVSAHYSKMCGEVFYALCLLAQNASMRVAY
jgi:hypothetical protein